MRDKQVLKVYSAQIDISRTLNREVGRDLSHRHSMLADSFGDVRWIKVDQHVRVMEQTFLALLLLMTPGLLMTSGVGAVCGGSQTQRPGEILLMCPLTEDVNQTKRSIVIGSFPYKGDAVIGLSCDWLARDPDSPDCTSSFNFTLEDLGKDCVVAKFPRTLLQRGSYMCNLVPQDKDQPFTTCRVLHSDDAEDPPTTISAVTHSTAADQTKEEPTGANGDHSGGLVPAVVALSFTVFILLLMMIVMAVLFLRLRKRSYSFSSDDDLILQAERREEEEKKNEVEKQRLMIQTLVDTWGQEDMVVFVPDATCEAENDVSSEGARQATTPDSETSSEDSESSLLGKDGKPLQPCCSM